MEQEQEQEQETIKSYPKCYLTNKEDFINNKDFYVPAYKYNAGGRFNPSIQNNIGDNNLSGSLFLSLNTMRSTIECSLPENYEKITKESINREYSKVEINIGDFILFEKNIYNHYAYKINDITNNDLFILELIN